MPKAIQVLRYDSCLQFLGPGCQPKVGILDLLLAMFMVCLLVTRMNCGKTAGPIEMPFGMWGGVGHSHRVLDGGLDLSLIHI